MTRTLAALAAIAAFALPAAATGDENFEFGFSYKTKEMASFSGAAEAYDRLYDQAYNACRPRNERVTLDLRAAIKECADQLVIDVVAEANAPFLTAAHEQSTGVSTSLAQNDTGTITN